jgi:hypothetical protein
MDQSREILVNSLAMLDSVMMKPFSRLGNHPRVFPYAVKILPVRSGIFPESQTALHCRPS